MNEQLFPKPEDSTPTTLCSHCHEPFTPRSGSGGKLQRFCKEKCRRAFHGLKEPTPPTPDAAPDVGDTPIADEKTPTVADVQELTTGNRKPDYLQNTWDFDWVKADCIVLR
jgi:hypothetical protein